MTSIRLIRQRLGITQAALAAGLGCTQGNVHHYERGQTVPPQVARRLIAFARISGVVVTYDQIYAEPDELATQIGANASTTSIQEAA